MCIQLYRIWRNAMRSLGLNQQRCAHCLAPFYSEGTEVLQTSHLLCSRCQELLEAYRGPRCQFCGVPSGPDVMTENAALRLLCSNCRKSPPPWSHFAYHGLYSGALRDLLLRLKFDGQIYLGKFFGGLLLEASACLPRPDAVLAIPQNDANLRARGYNQAHEIARALANLGNFRLEHGLLARVRRGRPQEGLTARERRENLHGAFAASAKAAGKVIWLVDDVMTTGSTYVEAVNALRGQNARMVCALFVARTPMW